ncbi:hypothetical protein YTPLAS72_27360 [Nitrospira sp.]|nr:hypothetical protein YTPLAS72_27360 [Nitrospira sp.]
MQVLLQKVAARLSRVEHCTVRRVHERIHLGLVSGVAPTCGGAETYSSVNMLNDLIEEGCAA